ncbi:probable serine/threonine protein kinase IREH1 isoform X2 [Gossypium arboreum]|uniref:probable serine/threonine protein kinase IREH1 isoform X2 n=1 Tax=Gossypium arboreum TaxID=29729 RepID=UPI0022F1B72A|nr:probable serine/threonine protein kinase IREH1 isoform X2 [Gossypium arboreum]
MVFKNKLFFSSKKSDSDGSNSPRSASNSPIRSDKKKPKASTSQQASTSISTSLFSPVACKQTQVKDGPRSKDLKPRTPPSKPSSSSTSKKPDAKDRSSSESPLLASSLGLNRIKTRSGPLPQETFFSIRGEKSAVASVLGASNLSRPGGSSSSGDGSSSKSGSGKKGVLTKRLLQDSLLDKVSNSDSISPGSGGGWHSREQSPGVQGKSRLQNGESSSGAGQDESSLGHSGGLKSSDFCTPEISFDCENPKESESPRFQAILRVTSGPRKRFPADIKSFSHELNSKGVRPFPLWKPRRLNNLEETLVAIRAKFDKAKEEVNSDLAIFAADLVGVLERTADSHPEWQETIEDLLVLARSCAMTPPGEFWLQCEGIVQELDDKRQELPACVLKQLYTRMLFILTRCTRLLQFHKESGLAEDEPLVQLRQSRVLHPVNNRKFSGVLREAKSLSSSKASKAALSKKSYSQEQHALDWSKDHVVLPGGYVAPIDDTPKNLESPASIDKITSWKKLPTPARKGPKEVTAVKVQHNSTSETLKRTGTSDVDLASIKLQELPAAKESEGQPCKHQHKVSSGSRGDQPTASEGSSIICRICEEEVPTSNVEDHSRICTAADRCDQNGLSVDERLVRIAETLEKMADSFANKDIQHLRSPDVAKASNSSVTEDSDVLSPKLSDWSRRGSEDMLDCFPEADNSVFMDDLKGLPSMSCKTRFGPKSDQGMTTSSAGSMTPRSPLSTPRTCQIDLLLSGKGAFSEQEDLPQMNELADIARCVANTPLADDRSMPYLLSCLDDLRNVIDRRKFNALTVETFGARIEKLIREKYLQLCELVEDEKVDIASTVIDEDAPLEDDVVRSLRTSPILSSKDRTSIDDFEIIKPISRGAFGRVFLTKKRTTGDLFAIKVLKKADMIRKNAVESILAERDILISVRNPFVVRFFYSFTCRENLYLVMEYLNGGDLYSLLRNLGCLDEEVARVYIAEVVLALEYLHSQHVVHRDLKPDNLLIAHDGHIKLTDFGLSKVGLINSTDDLSGPAVSGTSLLDDEQPQLSASEHQQERRKKRSAVGTPDYLAPEILLGTGHGATADWWSVGVILFELIVGIPPFNAEHPQTIFDNILNRKIPWPRVPEEMSLEAHDLIDRLLTEDPHQRLGARGASEVKQHVFFKDINWDTLARQKAAFVPSSESALDTSYFTSRYSWNPSDDHVYPGSELGDSSDADSLSGSSGYLSNHQDEGDECGGLTEFESISSVNYSFSNFSFKNLSQLASINYDLLSKGWKDDHPANNSNA